MMRTFAIAAFVAVAFQAYSAPPLPPPPKIVAPAQQRADAQSYISAEDYPATAERLGEQGSVGFIVDIAVNGRVTGCSVTKSSGSSSLDAATCRIMRSRARFTPARDSNGNPAAWKLEQHVTWNLPERVDAELQAAPEGQGMMAHSPPPRGYGMISNSTSPPAAVVAHIPGAVVNEPIMAIPQDGPGEADLSIWDARKPKEIRNLGRYPSIPECRKAKARLGLDRQQRAYCTVAPVETPDWGIH